MDVERRKGQVDTTGSENTKDGIMSISRIDLSRRCVQVGSVQTFTVALECVRETLHDQPLLRLSRLSPSQKAYEKP